MNSKQPETSPFSELVLGLSSAALYYLGEMQIDGHTSGDVNLDLARQNIDFVKILQEKTKGNLDEQENDLLSSVLIDLQVKFSAKSKH